MIKLYRITTFLDGSGKESIDSLTEFDNIIEAEKAVAEIIEDHSKEMITPPSVARYNGGKHRKISIIKTGRDFAGFNHFTYTELQLVSNKTKFF